MAGTVSELYNFCCILLGRNAPANEPWPDVLGVAVVFLVTGMFMLGLEVSLHIIYIDYKIP